MLGDERLVRGLDGGQLEVEALRILEAQAPRLAGGRDSLRAQALRPEAERLVGGNSPDDPMHHAGAGLAAPCARILEEGDVRARAAVLVRVEEVVDRGVVLVDRLLDEAEAEHPCVEVDVTGCVARDRRDVVNPFQLHQEPSIVIEYE